MHFHNGEAEGDVGRELIAELVAHGLVLVRVAGQTPVHARDAAAQRIRITAN